jgi:hypothetical protein
MTRLTGLGVNPPFPTIADRFQDFFLAIPSLY